MAGTSLTQILSVNPGEREANVHEFAKHQMFKTRDNEKVIGPGDFSRDADGRHRCHKEPRGKLVS